ncbi:hypothetical protein M514_02593 [Trichuris suis]|uniref:Uncharacterized protein n=1 Tax=Trichuris suis TaxID=68888 RepID=A0A085MGZ3_9BILA|nr:hypothetical protein M513_02593 [Trichuris suis]KFD71018.1 hypothetical protein M514_02593 [Trichuris suis]
MPLRGDYLIGKEGIIGTYVTLMRQICEYAGVPVPTDGPFMNLYPRYCSAAERMAAEYRQYPMAHWLPDGSIRLEPNVPSFPGTQGMAVPLDGTQLCWLSGLGRTKVQVGGQVVYQGNEMPGPLLLHREGSTPVEVVLEQGEIYMFAPGARLYVQGIRSTPLSVARSVLNEFLSTLDINPYNLNNK